MIEKEVSNKELRLQPLFDAMDKAGGPKKPDIKSLTSAERSRVSFSVWAFLFNIAYYLYHGMWKKGLFLLSVCIVLVSLIGYFFPGFPAWIITSVMFATFAPINLYSKYKLNDDGWNFLK